jgi:hypothetical protein
MAHSSSGSAMSPLAETPERDDHVQEMSEIGREPAVVATFGAAWEAESPRQYLANAGIPAWVDGPGLDDPYRSSVREGAARLLVPPDRIEEARALLADVPWAQAEDPFDSTRSHPRWIRVAAAVALAALVLSLVPFEISALVLPGAVGGYVVWRFLHPRDGGVSQRSDGGPDAEQRDRSEEPEAPAT